MAPPEQHRFAAIRFPLSLVSSLTKDEREIVYHERGNPDKALAYFYKAVHDPEIGLIAKAVIYFRIASLCEQRNLRSQAAHRLLQALKIFYDTMGPAHRLTLETRCQLGGLFRRIKEHKKSLKQFQAILDVRDLEDGNSYTPRACRGKALVYSWLGRYHKAHKYYLAAFEKAEFVTDGQSPDMVVIQSELGRSYFCIKDWENAAANLDEVLHAKLLRVPLRMPEDEAVKFCNLSAMLGVVQQLQDHPARALAHFEEALSLIPFQPGAADPKETPRPDTIPKSPIEIKDRTEALLQAASAHYLAVVTEMHLGLFTAALSRLDTQIIPIFDMLTSDTPTRVRLAPEMIEDVDRARQICLRALPTDRWEEPVWPSQDELQLLLAQFAEPEPPVAEDESRLDPFADPEDAFADEFAI